MECTAQTSPLGLGQPYGVVRTSPFQFPQTAVGGHTVTSVGSVGVMGKSYTVDLAVEQDSELEAQ
jgi:hypothetical protein